MLKTREHFGTHTVVSLETTAPMKLKFCTIVGPMDLESVPSLVVMALIGAEKSGVGKLSFVDKKYSFFLFFIISALKKFGAIWRPRSF